MKQLTIFVLSLFLLLTLTVSAFAHSGCCSWHGGVRADGCGCNDGTPLSSTCAPYYTCTAPQTNTSSTTTNSYQPAYVAPTDTPIPPPTYTPVPLPTATPTPKPTATPTPTKVPTATTTPKNIPTRSPSPTTAVLGTSTKSNTLEGFFLVFLAPIVIIGSLWWGRKIIKQD